MLGAAISLSNLGQFDRAIEYYKKVLDIDKNHEMALIGKGWIDCVAERYDEGMACLDLALKINPTNVNAMYTKGMGLTRANKMEEGKKLLQLASVLGSNEAKMLLEDLKRK